MYCHIPVQNNMYQVDVVHYDLYSVHHGCTACYATTYLFNRCAYVAAGLNSNWHSLNTNARRHPAGKSFAQPVRKPFSELCTCFFELEAPVPGEVIVEFQATTA